MKNLAAVIEFSLIGIQFVVSERTEESYKILEEAFYPIELDDVIDNKNRLQEINKVCDILLEIKKSIRAYNINSRSIKLFSSDRLKSFENQEFLREQIKIKTGLSLEILELSQEMIFLYKKLLSSYEAKLIKENSIFLFFSHDKISFYQVKKGIVNYFQEIPFTPIKLRELLENLNFGPEKSQIVVEENLRNYLEIINTSLIKMPENLYIISENFYDIFNANKGKFVSKIDEILFMKEEKIRKTFSKEKNSLDCFKEKLLILKAFINMNSFKTIIPLNYSLTSSIVLNSFFTGARRKYDSEVKESIIKSCEFLRKRYFIDSVHPQKVKEYANKIFLELFKDNQLNNKDLIILECSAILKDIGRYLSLRNYYENSFEIIKRSTVFGLSKHSMRKIAILAFFHGNEEARVNHHYFVGYDDSEKIKLIKLIAILKIANAIDKVNRFQIKGFSTKLEKGTLIFEIDCSEEPIIETSTLEKRVELFREIFGLDFKFKFRRI
jgi:exopolyphosphatase/guanosine-5'-triphosphate,3'-diphosphate pyrophosphatase